MSACAAAACAAARVRRPLLMRIHRTFMSACMHDAAMCLPNHPPRFRPTRRAFLQPTFRPRRYEAVRELIESREAKLRNAVIMMKLRMVQHCFHEWSSKCVGVERRREMRTRQILGRIRNRAAVICLQVWIEATQRQLKLKAYYAARWANILLAKLFLAWAHTAYREASIKLRLRAMAIRMARRTEVIVLQEWHHYASEVSTSM